MSTFEIKQLYNHRRFVDSANQVIYLSLYVPIGVSLLILRIILGLTVYLLSYVLPHTQTVQNTLHKLVCIVFGIVINVENPDRREDVEAFISNQVSIFDPVVAHFATECIMPGIKSRPLILSIFGIPHFCSLTNFEDFKRKVEGVTSEIKGPLHFQPESKITNGKALLTFNTWPFAVTSKVQPLIISVHRPGLGIPVSAFDSNYWTDVFFFMFTPCTVYRLKFLSVVEKKGLSDSDFAEKIRQDIGKELKVELTNYSAADLREFEKRIHVEQQRITRRVQRPVNSSVNLELHRMSLQVREVLPLVPYNVIYQDLAKTRSVDITITNILEGHVQYTPEQPKPSSSTSNTSSSSSLDVSPSRESTSVEQNLSGKTLSTAAPTFGKSPHERTLSFQERKKLLIENARKRYIEKHGLNIVGS